jgi:hypothetical protein
MQYGDHNSIGTWGWGYGNGDYTGGLPPPGHDELDGGMFGPVVIRAE